MKRGQPIRNKLIECPLCESKVSTPERFAEHIHAWHISNINWKCPCCNGQWYMMDWKTHATKNVDAIVAALHAQLLGVDPHEK